MGWVGNEGVNINWEVSAVSSPVTVLSHRGEFNKVTIRVMLMKFDEAGTLKSAPPTLLKGPLTDWLADLKTDGLDDSKKIEI